MGIPHLSDNVLQIKRAAHGAASPEKIFLAWLLGILDTVDAAEGAASPEKIFLASLLGILHTVDAAEGAASPEKVFLASLLGILDTVDASDGAVAKIARLDRALLRSPREKRLRELFVAAAECPVPNLRRGLSPNLLRRSGSDRAASHLSRNNGLQGWAASRDEIMAIQDLICESLGEQGSQWSAGTYGAIAEFSRDPFEPADVVCTHSGGEASTARGGVRVELRREVRAVAYEITTKDRGQWGHAIALCLPEEACAMGRRTTIHALGPDSEAIRPEDRDSILFDLGLGTLQVDACVRTSQPELLSALRGGEGRPLFDIGNPATAAIFKANPHRVFVTRIGRAEVYQPIPPEDGKSPDGPHTHLLQKFLRIGRTHAATTPIPTGWIPCLHLYPAHPQKDRLGAAKPINRAEYAAFQKALALFGDPELLELKRRVIHGVACGDRPEDLPVPQSRFARGVIRVALRQLHALNGSSPTLSRWRQKYDLAERAEASD